MIVSLSNAFRYLFRNMEIKCGINLLDAFSRLKSGLANYNTVCIIYKTYLRINNIDDNLLDPLLDIVLNGNLSPCRDEAGIPTGMFETRNTVQILNTLRTDNIISINVEIINSSLSNYLISELNTEENHANHIYRNAHNLTLINLFGSNMNPFLLANKSLKLCYRLYNQLDIKVDVDPRLENFMVYRFAKENNCLNSEFVSDIILRNWFDKQVFIEYLNEDILGYTWKLYFSCSI